MRSPHFVSFVASLLVATSALAQGTGDDRVSLPDGPGSLDGLGDDAEVNAAQGSFRLSVPVRLPESFAGISPNVDVGYDSNGGNGVVGVGFSLPLPQIERLTVKGMPDYDDDDLMGGPDGQLVKVSDGEPAVYRARFEGGFVRYRWYDRGAGDEGHWTAELPDGVVLSFGADSDGNAEETARVRGPDGVLRWHLVDAVDVWGHRTRYTWRIYGSTPLLDLISYAYENPHTAGADPGDDDEGDALQSVAFDYEERPDVLEDAKGGFKDVLAHRLSGITVFTRNVTLRRYAFAYDDGDGVRVQSRLVRVQEFGRDGGKNPIERVFGYSRALGGVCDDDNAADGDCGAPQLFSMGAPLGVSFASGETSLIDLNGDALPDIVKSTAGQPHTIFLAEMAPSGALGFAAARTSAQGSGHDLSSPLVQELDVDGDGFVDLLSSSTGEVLLNTGSGDWSAPVALGADAVSDLPDFAEDFDDATGGAAELAHVRFMDADLDHHIDVFKSDGASTSLLRDTGAGFVSVDGVTALDKDFATDHLDLADENGDGLQDAVVLGQNSLTVFPHLGRGRFAASFTMQNVVVDDEDLEFASLTDLDGDGRDDLVVVVSGEVRYQLNTDGRTFGDVVVVDSAGGAAVPQRDDKTVLFADMNGNGSDDVVWIDTDGQVTVLDLFPLRPGLITRVENGLGAVTDVGYATSVSVRANAATPWAHPVPMAAIVVVSTDSYQRGVASGAGDDIDELHDVDHYDYRDGYWDGDEKQFRGYARVTLTKDAALQQAGSVGVVTYDVGDARGPAFAGRVLAKESQTDDGVLLATSTTTYERCPVSPMSADPAEAAAAAADVVFVCATGSSRTEVEGRPAAEQVTTARERSYDGYGNVVVDKDQGVVGSGCGPCAEFLADGESAGACGATCSGDENIVTTTWASPDDNLEGRWLLRLIVEEQQQTREGAGARVSVERSFYDGAAYVGEARGVASKGALVRVSRRVLEGSGGDDVFVDVTRHQIDDDGNLVDAVGPRGTPEGQRFHQRFVWDDRGLSQLRTALVVGTTGNAGAADDDESQLRVLVRDVTYDPINGEVDSSTPWYLEGESPAGVTRYQYDEHGRRTAIVAPGDSSDAPSSVFTWDLKEPVSRIVVEKRTQRGGPLDLVQIECIDGQGQKLQTRTQQSDGHFFVSGFAVYNARGAVIRSYEPYVSTSSECETAPPADVAFTAVSLDAVGREVEVTLPDGTRRGTPSQRKIERLPLTLRQLDEEDADDDAAFKNTPAVLRYDGLGRVIAAERTDEDGAVVALRFAWDERNALAAVVGNDGAVLKRQTRDLLGRIVAVDDSDHGRFTYDYDVDNTLLREHAPDGRVVRRVSDDLGRVTAVYDEADVDGTLQEIFYDVHPACASSSASSACANQANRLAGSRVASAVFGSVVDAYGYDARGNLTASSRSLGDLTLSSTMEFDDADRLIATVFPDGRRVAMALDGAGNVTAVPGYVDAIRHDDRAFIAGYRLANGVDVAFSHDDRDDLAGITASGPKGALIDLALERDRRGRVTAVVDAVASGEASLSATYGRDAFGRLTSVERAGETQSFTYDAFERLTSSPAGSYAYDADSAHAASDVGGVGFGVDAAGRVVARGSDSYDFDALSHLRRVQRDGADVIAYEYAADGARHVEQAGGRTKVFFGSTYEIEDGVARLRVAVAGDVVVEEESAALMTQVIGDEDGDDVITAHDALAKSGLDRRAALRAAARALLLASDDADARRYFHADHLGSVVAVSDAGGGVVERFRYAPYGEVAFSSSVHSEHARYTGRPVDEAGLIDLGARVLLPHEGRFLTPDPTFRTVDADVFDKLPEAFAGYSVAGNDPVTFIDLDGRFPWKKVLIGVGVVAGVAAVAALTATGILPVVGLAAGVVATTAAIVGAVVGGVVGGVGAAINAYTRLKALYPNQPIPAKELWLSAASVALRVVLGAASGFMSFGLSAVTGVASDVVTYKVLTNQISPQKGVLLRLGIGVVGGVAAGISTDLIAHGLQMATDGAALSASAVSHTESTAVASGVAAAAEVFFHDDTVAEAKTIKKYRLRALWAGRRASYDIPDDEPAQVKKRKLPKLLRRKSSTPHLSIGNARPL